jgi:dihydropteroate synthase
VISWLIQSNSLKKMLHAWPTPLPPASLNCRGRLLTLDRPRILGILNLTPDSFSDGGLIASPAAALARALVLLGQGADVLDLGAVSTRPGATEITAQAEWTRLAPVLQFLRRELPDAFLSIDTWRAEVAQRALDAGANIINDISGGQWEPDILRIAAQAQAPTS